MKKITYKSVELSTAEELHDEAMGWLSELNFIGDEQRFLNELITEYTIPLISAKIYNKSLSLIGGLVHEERELESIVESIKLHNNEIDVLLKDKGNAKEVEAYKKSHYYLKVDVYTYTEKYRATKAALFDEIKKLMKKEPPKRLSK